MKNLPPQINDILKKNYSKIEAVLLLLILVGLFLKSSSSGLAGVILGISIGVIGILYYLGAFLKTDFEDMISLMMNKVLHIIGQCSLLDFSSKYRTFQGLTIC